MELNFAVAGEDVAPDGGEVVAVDAVAAPAGAETGEAKDGAEAEAETAEAAPAPAPPPASLLRPATKFRVLLLKLRKPKVAVPADGNVSSPAPKQASRFLIKFRVDDAPLVSLFTGDNSSRTSDAGADRPAAAAAQAPAQHPQDQASAIIRIRRT